MFVSKNLLLLALAVAPSAAFVTTRQTTNTAVRTVLQSSLTQDDASMTSAIRKQINYQAGAADTDFARQFQDRVGQPVRTVGEAFAQFTQELGVSINPLYKSMVTDLVGTTHLILVNARFQRDPIWSLGILTATELLLKNYPEPEMGQQIVSALFRSVGLDESEIRAEAKAVTDWLESSDVTKQDVEAVLMGEGSNSSPITAAVAAAKDNEFWMYSRYFGIGMIKMMESVGVAMDKDEVYPVLEDWMSNKIGRSHLTACADSDMFFRIKEKLDIMETMMKEIEIREKKRMAERLEEKAEAALRAADREVMLQNEIKVEAAMKRETVEA